MDLLALNFQVPDMVVYGAIGLGIVTAVGLVIREQVQGGETGIVSSSVKNHQQSHTDTDAK